jgi:quercetin dioxygenase-like cupin family protein
MKNHLTFIVSLALTPLSGAQEITVSRAGSRPAQQAPADNFTGTARVERLIDAPAPARATTALVTFDAGARTAWHTHPLGQTLIVTAGVGRVQQWGGPLQEIRAGDTVRIPPNVIRLRIDAARRLLRETKKSVITIANEVGYSNPSHFAQVFRKETGLSPTDYRRER